MLVAQAAEHRVASARVGEREGAQGADAAHVGERRARARELAQAGHELAAAGRDVLRHLLLQDDVDDLRGAHHVREVATPRRVDPARAVEAVLGHVVNALARVDAGLLGLLGEGHDVRGHAELLPQPRGAGAEEARLHLVEDQQRFLLVRIGAQLLQELGSEVVVAALRLHGLDQDRRDLALVLGEGALDLGAGARLGGDDVIGDPAVEVELDAGVVHARPAELGEQARLRGIRVGERERVARAAVEGVLEVQHDEVVAALVQVAPAELLRLPVEGHLDRVLVG